MYPTAELMLLQRGKASVRARIATNRLYCAALAAEVAKPIGWLERTLVQWRKISPFMKIAAIPLGFLLRRKLRLVGKIHPVRRLLRWLPAVMGAVRMVSRQRAR